MEENNQNKSTFSTKIRGFYNKLTDKDGFYIILFICICIVATTAVWVSMNNYNRIEMLKDQQNTDLVEEEDPDDLLLTEEATKEEESDTEVIQVNENTVPKDTEEKNQSQEEQKTKGTEEQNVLEASAVVQQPTTSTEKTNKEILSGMLVPLMGKISLDYAEDKLVYSKTLEQWTTHHGIDIAAREGSAVRAVLDGVISEIKDDPALGIVITIDHGNGIKTRYGNLSTDEMVKVGQNVKKGDTISGVGKGAKFEMAEGPHLHFEVLIDGKNVDPKLYLPKFE